MRKQADKIITFVAIFIVGVSGGWIVGGRHWDIFFSAYIPALATLLAAYYGARFAFQFQKDKENEDSKKHNVISGNSAIFTLMRMICTLSDIQKQIIDPTRNHLQRFIRMEPGGRFTNEEIKLDIESLYFLLESDDGNLLPELVNESNKYHTAIGAFDERSRIHREEVQPLLDRSGFREGANYSNEQIRTAIGDRLYMTMQRSTEQTINIIDETVISLKKISHRLQASLKKQYPTESIINFEIAE